MGPPPTATPGFMDRTGARAAGGRGPWQEATQIPHPQVLRVSTGGKGEGEGIPSPKQSRMPGLSSSLVAMATTEAAVDPRGV